MINEKSIHYQVDDIVETKMKTLTGNVVEKIKAAMTIIDDSLEASDGTSFRYPFKVLIERDNNNNVQYKPNQQEVYDFLNVYNPQTEEEFKHDIDVLLRIVNNPLMHEDCQRLMAKQSYELIPLTLKKEDMFSDDYVAKYHIRYKAGAGEWTVSEASVVCRIGSNIEVSGFQTDDTILKQLKDDITKDIKKDLEEYIWQQRDRSR